MELPEARHTSVYMAAPKVVRGSGPRDPSLPFVDRPVASSSERLKWCTSPLPDGPPCTVCPGDGLREPQCSMKLTPTVDLEARYYGLGEGLERVSSKEWTRGGSPALSDRHQWLSSALPRRAPASGHRGRETALTSGDSRPVDSSPGCGGLPVRHQALSAALPTGENGERPKRRRRLIWWGEASTPAAWRNELGSSTHICCTSKSTTGAQASILSGAEGDKARSRLEGRSAGLTHVPQKGRYFVAIKQPTG